MEKSLRLVPIEEILKSKNARIEELGRIIGTYNGLNKDDIEVQNIGGDAFVYEYEKDSIENFVDTEYITIAEFERRSGISSGDLMTMLQECGKRGDIPASCYINALIIGSAYYLNTKYLQHFEDRYAQFSEFIEKNPQEIEEEIEHPMSSSLNSNDENKSSDAEEQENNNEELTDDVEEEDESEEEDEEAEKKKERDKKRRERRQKEAERHKKENEEQLRQNEKERIYSQEQRKHEDEERLRQEKITEEDRITRINREIFEARTSSSVYDFAQNTSITSADISRIVDNALNEYETTRQKFLEEQKRIQDTKYEEQARAETAEKELSKKHEEQSKIDAQKKQDNERASQIKSEYDKAQDAYKREQDNKSFEEKQRSEQKAHIERINAAYSSEQTSQEHTSSYSVSFTYSKEEHQSIVDSYSASQDAVIAKANADASAIYSEKLRREREEAERQLLERQNTEANKARLDEILRKQKEAEELQRKSAEEQARVEASRREAEERTRKYAEESRQKREEYEAQQRKNHITPTTQSSYSKSEPVKLNIETGSVQYISGNPYVVKDSQIDRFEQIKKEYESPGATSTETKQALKSEFSPYVPPESTPEYRPTRENTQNTTIIFQDNQVVAEIPTSYASKFEDAIKTAPQSSFSDGKAVIYAAMASGAILDNGFKMSSPEENDRLSVTRDAFRDVCARQAEALYGITNGEEFVANQIYKKSHNNIIR